MSYNYGFQGGSPGGGNTAGPGSFGPMGGGYAPQAGYPPQGNYPPPGASYSSGGYNNSAVGFSDPYMTVGRSNISDIAFAASSCIIVGAFASGISYVTALEVADWIFMSYLLFFGILLALLDAPILTNLRTTSDAKMYIGKYLQFVTRLTGKGVALLFLGSALFMSMWNNLAGGMWMFLAVILSTIPVLVGLLLVGLGFIKSSKLEKARRQLELTVDQRFDQYSQTYRGPQGGLTMGEFNQLLSQDFGIVFEAVDVKLIFNALCSNPMWKAQASAGVQGASQYQNFQEEGVKLSRQDLIDWCKGGWVFL